MRIPVEIKGLAVDPASNVPMVILRGKQPESAYVLPIWVGGFEANAIALELEGVQPPRPMTHDLLLTLVQELRGKVIDVVIRDVIDSTYYATVTLERDGERIEVDARPSDAIALALRAGAEVYVEKIVIDKAQAFDVGSSDPEKLRAWFENLDIDELIDQGEAGE